MWKAKSIFNKKNDHPVIKTSFVVSSGWCEKFMQRHGFSLRQKTTTAQKDPSYLNDRIAAYVMHVRRIQKQFNFHDANIIVMDETSVWNDMVSNTTVEKTVSKEIPMKSTGHNKVRVACNTRMIVDARLSPPFSNVK